MSTQSRLKSDRSIALRAVVSGLLASPLTDSEIKKFAQDLDLEFLANLREALLSFHFPRSDQSDDTPPPLGVGENIGEIILNHSKGRRLSKNQVYAYMHDIDDSLARSVIRPGYTMRESIEQFINASGPDVASRLLSRVLGSVEQDPYLVGISKRK